MSWRMWALVAIVREDSETRTGGIWGRNQSSYHPKALGMSLWLSLPGRLPVCPFRSCSPLLGFTLCSRRLSFPDSVTFPLPQASAQRLSEHYQEFGWWDSRRDEELLPKATACQVAILWRCLSSSPLIISIALFEPSVQHREYLSLCCCSLGSSLNVTYACLKNSPHTLPYLFY